MNLASTIEKQVELRQKVKSAMTYPVAVLCLVLMILTAMLLFVVPMLGFSPGCSSQDLRNAAGVAANCTIGT